jgi:hypothetical protein
MGAYLSEPNLNKISNDNGNDNISFGASSMQGWRVTQEVIIFYFILIFVLSSKSLILVLKLIINRTHIIQLVIMILIHRFLPFTMDMVVLKLQHIVQNIYQIYSNHLMNTKMETLRKRLKKHF